MENNEITFSKLMDSSQEEFTEYCKDKDLGYLCNFRALVVSTYEDVVKIKEGLVNKIQDNNIQEGSPEHESIKNLFTVLFRIEGKSILLDTFIKDLERASKEELS